MALSTTLGIEFIARNLSAAGIRSFNNSLSTTTHYLRRLMTAALAAAGVYGIGYMIKQEMEAVHVTTNLANRLGMTTEALVGLQHGAKMTDVEQEQLTRSLDFFNRKLGEMQLGSASAQAALTQIGVSYRDLRDKSPDEAIGIVADQMNKLSSESQKAAVMQDLFGKGSQSLLGLFAQGSKGMAAYRLEAEKLGLSFSALDAAQIEGAIEALTRLRSVFVGIFRQGAIELAPYIEAAASAFVDWATQGEGVGANITSVFESVTLAIAQTIEETERLIMKLGQLGSPLDYLKKVSEANKRAIEQYRSITGDVEAFRNTQGLLRPPTQPRDPYMWEVVQNVQKQAAGLEPKSRESEIRAAFDKIRIDAAARAEVAVNRDKARAALPSMSESFALSAEENKQIVDRTRQAVDSIRHMDGLTRMERIANLKAYAAANTEELGKVAEANRLLNDEILAIERSRVDAMVVYQAELREDMQSFNLYLSERFAEASRSMESALSNSFQTMIRDGASWRDATIQYLTEVQNAFIKMAADIMARKASESFIEPIMSGLLNTITGGVGPGKQVVSPNTSPNYSTTYSNAGIAPVVGHRGGRVGDLSERRLVNSSIFENAPRFHDLRPGETAVIAQNDEVISRPGRSRDNQPPSVVINNYTGQSFESQGPSFESERWVVGIVAQNIKQNGGLKKMMRR